MASQGQAQDANWDVSPYEVEVWLALQPVPELTDGWREGIVAEIERAAELACGASWHVVVQDAPAELSKLMLTDYESVSADMIKASSADLNKKDKMYLVAVSSIGAGYELKVREFDTRCEYLGPIVSHQIIQPIALGTTLAESVLEAFSPVGVIERVRDDQVFVRMRAGLLAVQDDSPLSLQEGGLLRPVLRKNDRLGQPIPGGLEEVPWTLLRVTKRRLDGLDCEIISGLKTPLRTRSSRRVERLVLTVKPTYDSTTIRLHALLDPNQPLAGYELYWRLPAEKTSTFAGRSDWEGKVVVPRDEHPIKLLYVKNGGRLIAKLPVCVGYEPLMQAAVTDDQLRLEAEGFLRGLQEEMVDVFAQRTVLAVRIRRRIEEKKIDEALSLVEAMEALPTRDDFDRRLRTRRQLMTTKDRAMQDKIDRMFRQTQEVLQKTLGGSEIETLRAEISAASNA
jgi:hypothetical protein